MQEQDKLNKTAKATPHRKQGDPRQLAAPVRTITKMRRFPSRGEVRAVELGADELIALCEWSFRARPRKLRNLRARYVDYCASLLREMERGA
jgi:hypothetical protein